MPRTGNIMSPDRVGPAKEVQHAPRVPGLVPVIVQPTPPEPAIGMVWWDTANVPSAVGGVISHRTETSNYTAVLTDNRIRVDASGGPVTITLPAAADRDGKVFFIKKVDATANAVTIAADGSELIDGTATKVLTSSTDLESLTVASFNTGWDII